MQVGLQNCHDLCAISYIILSYIHGDDVIIHVFPVTDTPGMTGKEAAPLVDVHSMHGGKATVIGVVLMTLLSFPGEIFSERDQ